MKKVLKLLILFLLLNIGFAYDINGDGSPVDFTKIGLTARYWGMGKAGAGYSNDSGSMMLNPAGLARAKSFEISTMATKLMDEFNYTMLNVVYPRDHESFGLSLLYETAGTIYETAGLDQYGHPEQGDTIENYNALVSFGYARPLFWDNFYVGGVVKNFKRKISYVEGSTNSLDLGCLYQWSEKLSLGLVVKNAVQTELKYSNGASYDEHMNQDYILGVSWLALDDKLLISLDQHSDASFGRTHLGTEYWWANMVAFRVGVAEGDLTVGVGFRYAAFQVDYAMRYQEQPLDNQAYISVTFGDATKLFLSRPEIEIADDDNSTADNMPENSTPAQKPSTTEKVKTITKQDKPMQAPTSQANADKNDKIQIVDY